MPLTLKDNNLAISSLLSPILFVSPPSTKRLVNFLFNDTSLTFLKWLINKYPKERQEKNSKSKIRILLKPKECLKNCFCCHINQGNTILGTYYIFWLEIRTLVKAHLCRRLLVGIENSRHVRETFHLLVRCDLWIYWFMNYFSYRASQTKVLWLKVVLLVLDEMNTTWFLKSIENNGSL